MTTLYGIWIDHEKTHIIKSDEMGNMTLSYLPSGVEPEHHGGIDTNEFLTLVNQKRHFERRKQHMKAFCKKILAQIKDADEILIFGPGEAKHELKNELERVKALKGKLKGLETTHPLTEAELKEFVEKFFKLPR